MYYLMFARVVLGYMCSTCDIHVYDTWCTCDIVEDGERAVLVSSGATLSTVQGHTEETPHEVQG